MDKDEALKLALETLEQTLETLDDENAKPGGAIADTIWYSEHITLFDYLASEITAIKVALAQPAQKPVAWPCVIAEANFEQNTITLEMQCSDYKVGAGQHWLYTTPPQRPWVGLTDEEISSLSKGHMTRNGFARNVIAQFKEKNNG